MIGRKHRFHGHHAVSRVKGKVAHTQLLSIRLADSGRKDYRLAVVVSKKVAPHAVTRNRIRRRVYELFRVRGWLDARPADVVVYVKSDALATMQADDLAKTVGAVYRKVAHDATSH